MNDKSKYLYIYSQDPDGYEDRLEMILGGESPDSLPFYDGQVEMEINKAERLTFSIPVAGGDSFRIREGQYVIWFDEDGQEYAFYISEVDEFHDADDRKYRQFTCENIGVKELNDEIVKDYNTKDHRWFYEMTFTNADVVTVLNRILQYSRWDLGNTLSADLTKTASFSLYENTAAEALAEIVKQYGVEIRFRIVHDGRKITRRFVDVFQQMGTNNGVRLDFGMDILEVKRYVNAANIKTALIGRGRGEESGDGFSRRIGFKDIEWKLANGDPADKPKGQDWVGINDPAVLSRWGIANGDGTFSPRMGKVIFEDETDPARLLQRTYDYLLQQIRPEVTYEMTIVDLSRLSGYEHKRTRLGDVVRCVDRALPWDYEIETRVIKKVFYIGEPERTEITLGTARPELGDVVKNIEDRQRDVVRPGDPLEWLNGELDLAKRRIISATSYIYIGDSQQYPGIFLPNKPAPEHGGDPDQAVYMTSGGILLAASKNPDGTFNWRTAITGAGIIADEIYTGTLNANLVSIHGVDDEFDQEIKVTNGRVAAYTSGRQTMSLNGYSLVFYDNALDTNAPDNKTVCYVGQLVQKEPGDPVGVFSRRGAGMVGYKDFLALTAYLGEELNMGIDGTWTPVFIFNRKHKWTNIFGLPSSDREDWVEMGFYMDNRPNLISVTGGGANIPCIEFLKGTSPIDGFYYAGCWITVGDWETPDGTGAKFVVRRVTGVNNRSRLFAVEVDWAQFYVDKIYFGNGSCQVDMSNGHARWQQSPTNYIFQSATDGSVHIYIGGTAKHIFKADGTKTGGTIEIDGKTWGMSPIDSPQVLIEDVIFDQPVSPEGVTVQLDSRLAKAFAKYAVFPNCGDVTIEKKKMDSFIVKGPKGTVDLRVIGIRVGTNQYFDDLDEDPTVREEKSRRQQKKMMIQTPEQDPQAIEKDFKGVNQHGGPKDVERFKNDGRQNPGFPE